MYLELIIAQCNRGPALTNPDTATSESEDEPLCKVPVLFTAYSKARQKLSREKNVTLRGQLGSYFDSITHTNTNYTNALTFWCINSANFIFFINWLLKYCLCQQQVYPLNVCSVQEP